MIKVPKTLKIKLSLIWPLLLTSILICEIYLIYIAKWMTLKELYSQVGFWGMSFFVILLVISWVIFIVEIKKYKNNK